MEIIENGIVISEDINLIMQGKNALGFNYQEKGLIVPNKSFITDLRDNLKKESEEAYQDKVTIVKEEEMSYYMNKFVDGYKGYLPIVSMDEIYIDCDNKTIFPLDCTRVTGQTKLVARRNPLDPDGVIKQVIKLANVFKKLNVLEIILADDIVYSGSVIDQISELFESVGIKVVGVIAAISSESGYLKFNKEMKYGLQCGYLMKENVVDEICERDFFFGIAQSGMIKIVEGIVYKAPYFLPFGDPVRRASIPEDNAISFSLGCIERSLKLMEEVEKKSNKTIFMRDLPERILNTKEDEEVIKVLRKVK